MSQLSAIEAPASTPSPRTPAPDPGRRPGAPDQDAISSFPLQGAIAFLAGGLVALICATASVLEPFENLEILGRFAGFALGGAIGGAGLVWGSVRKHAPRGAAFGFGLGFLIAAYVAGGAVGHLLAIKPEDYGIGTYVGNAMALTIGYGIAGAIGGAFIQGRLFSTGAVRFGLAGLAGSVVLSTVPAFGFMGEAVGVANMAGLAAALLLGHLVPFVGGGYWFGRAIASQERLLRKTTRPRRNLAMPS